MKKLTFLLGIAIVMIVALMFRVNSVPVAEATVNQTVCFCHNLNNNPHTICTSNNALKVGHTLHAIAGNDSFGVCEEPEVEDVCDNIEGVQEETPEGYVNEQGYCYIPEEPTDYCDTLEGVQAEDEDCPKEEDPTPTPTETPKDGGWSPEPEGNRSTTNAPGVCSISDIGNVANINVVTTGNAGELEVQWSLPANADKVHIIYGLEQKAEHALLNTDNDGNEVIRNLVSGKHYWFAVAGVRGCGVGSYSNWFDPIVP